LLFDGPEHCGGASQPSYSRLTVPGLLCLLPWTKRAERRRPPRSCLSKHAGQIGVLVGCPLTPTYRGLSVGFLHTRHWTQLVSSPDLSKPSLSRHAGQIGVLVGCPLSQLTPTYRDLSVGFLHTRHWTQLVSPSVKENHCPQDEHPNLTFASVSSTPGLKTLQQLGHFTNRMQASVSLF
jgi:hypothetical protein